MNNWSKSPPQQEHIQRTPARENLAHDGQAGSVLLSFDIESHDCIEASSKITIDSTLREHYRGRQVIAARLALIQVVDPPKSTIDVTDRSQTASDFSLTC